MRITLDEQRDQATIYLSDERQSYKRGATFAVLVVDEDDEANPGSDPIMVQLGFEEYERLLWIEVSRASKALPEALLVRAERR